jgi:hypothetical protein
MAEAVHPMPVGSGHWLLGVKVSDESRWNGPTQSEVVADVELVHHSDAGSHIFPERFLISSLISGGATG